MDKVTLTIDGQQITANKDMTVLEAALENGIYIPHLCYHPDLEPVGVCRMCMVEIEGRPLTTSCNTPVEEGMIVQTDTPEVGKIRRAAVELLIVNHFEDYRQSAGNNPQCEFLQVANYVGIDEERLRRLRRTARTLPIDDSSPAIIRDPNRCILCGKCIRVCSEIQSVGAIDFANRGGKTLVSTFLDKGMNNVECTNCGQCVLACPTDALHERSAVDEVRAAISDHAPAVRASIGEEFGMPPGSLVTGKMAAALRRLGFDKVFDTQFAADLTIMEEAHELVERIKNGGVLPMITSCSPGWIKYDEHFFPECLEHISTCKSPQQMFGPIAKTYYAEKIGVKPEDMYVVSVMPCTAKKFEAQRPEMRSSGFQDVDAVLTTREAAQMIKEAGVDFVNLPDEDFDEPLGMSTGAAVIFGATGGVMEAALRTAYEVVTGKTLGRVEFGQVRGMEGIKEAEINLDGLNLKVAVAHGLSNAKVLLEQVRDGVSPYHFIEVMACPGGCLGGGGQPVPTDLIKPTNLEIRKARAASLYVEDEGKSIRKSHENPAIIALYEEFLGEPLSERAHHLLHTTYTERGRY